MAQICLEGVGKRFGDVTAVADVDLLVHRGEFFSLLGPSGCGKTTTLRLVAGLEQPTAGVIRLGDRDVTHVPAHRRELAMVFQNYALFPHRSVLGNVLYGLQARRVPRAEQRRRALDALDYLGLADLAARRVDELSGGQQQRVALARAVVLRPAVLLLDEPLSNLDAALRVETRAVLRRVQQEVGCTALYVTHDQEEALVLSDRLAVLRDGHVLQVGSPREVYEQPANTFTARFLGRANLCPGTLVSRDSETCRVRLAAGVETVVRPGAGPPAGEPATVLFRPETLRLVPRGGLPGVVRSSTFQGAWREVVVEAGGAEWLVVEPHGAAAGWEPGAAVGVELPPLAGVLVPQ